MPGLICVFDGVDRNGLRYTTNYLSKKFEGEVQIVSYDGEDNDCLLATNVNDMLEHLRHRQPLLVITNHLPSVPHLHSAKYKTVLWLTDRNGNSILKRQENIQFWRQTMGLLKSHNEPIYAASQYMAKQILTSFRMPCKVLHPYIEPADQETPGIVYYNEPPVQLYKLRELMPDQPFEQLKEFEDLKNGKLYIHSSRGLEYSNIEIPVAHSYGVPCLIEDNGSLSEYVTNGDRALPTGADEKQWTNAFKIAMRDRDINSDTVKKLSFRYSHMSEIEERIKQVLQKSKPMRKPTFQEIQAIAKRRDMPARPMPVPKAEKKQPVKPVVIGNGLPKNDVDHVKNFLSSNERVYFGCGGLGDAMLTIAGCHKDPHARVIFGANHENVKALFDAFKIDVMVTRNFYPSVLGMTLHHYIITHPNFKGSFHIPDSMNFMEWVNSHDKYLKRITRSMPLKDIFGRMINPRKTSGVVGICPRGSDHHSLVKQRFLTVDEFKKLTNKFLAQNKTVYAFGSVADIEHYGSIQNNNFIWMSGDYGVSHPAPKYPTSFRHMLSCINGCDELYSVDTWLKTYGALAGISTKVILSRRNGAAIQPPNDASDYIFMNREFWGFDFVDVKDLLA
jgi:hypothetical protein